MPTAHPESETESEFINRCVPIVLDDGTTDDKDQAVAICQSIWDEATVENDLKGNGEMDKETKFLDSCVVVKEINDDDRIVPFIVTKRVVDRDGDLLEPSGADLDNFEKNPVINLNHDIYNQLPIGKAVKIKRNKEEIKVWIKFATKEENPIAANVYRLIKGGYLNATSIGFIPDFSEIDHPDNMTVGGKKVFTHYKKYEIYEISIVNVPANPAALRTEKSLTSKDKAFLMGKSLEPTWADIEALTKRIEVLEEKLTQTIETETVDAETEIKTVEESEQVVETETIHDDALIKRIEALEEKLVQPTMEIVPDDMTKYYEGLLEPVGSDDHTTANQDDDGLDGLLEDSNNDISGLFV
jgi:HK97 family phage prohead protease